MDEPRDDIDTWLEERVTPLLPHPGAFEQIRRRARRRKLGRAALTAAGAVVVVAGAITVPRLILSGGFGGTPTAQSGPTTPVQRSSPAPGQPTATGTSGPDDQPPRHPRPPAPPAVPANFAASSVTFVSTSTGWVIGQAGTPGHCGPPNPYDLHLGRGHRRRRLDLARRAGTGHRRAGRRHRGQPDPVPGRRQRLGVRAAVVRHPRRRTALDTDPDPRDAGDRPGNGERHRLRGVGPVRQHGRGLRGGLHQLLAVLKPGRPRRLVTGAGRDRPAGERRRARLRATGPHRHQGLPDDPGRPVVQRPGHPSRALAHGHHAGGRPGAAPVRARGPRRPAATRCRPCWPPPGPGLALLCADQASGNRQAKTLYYSADGGRSWSPAGSAPARGIAMSLSGTPGGPVLVATSSGIDVSANAPGASGALTWRTAHGATAPGGYSYVGHDHLGAGRRRAGQREPGRGLVHLRRRGALGGVPGALTATAPGSGRKSPAVTRSPRSRVKISASSTGS